MSPIVSQHAQFWWWWTKFISITATTRTFNFFSSNERTFLEMDGKSTFSTETTREEDNSGGWWPVGGSDGK
jgi:hypothetical protein